MEIRVYATLRRIVEAKSIHLDGAEEMSVEGMLLEILTIHPGLRPKVLDEDGQLLPAIQVLVNGRDVRYLSGLETRVTPEDDVRMFPPVGGGCRAA